MTVIIGFIVCILIVWLVVLICSMIESKRECDAIEKEIAETDATIEMLKEQRYEIMKELIEKQQEFIERLLAEKYE